MLARVRDTIYTVRRSLFGRAPYIYICVCARFLCVGERKDFLRAERRKINGERAIATYRLNDRCGYDES